MEELYLNVISDHITPAVLTKEISKSSRKSSLYWFVAVHLLSFLSLSFFLIQYEKIFTLKAHNLLTFPAIPYCEICKNNFAFVRSKM